MIVVADSGPVNYLVLIGQADLLFQFYRSLLIPAAVARELSCGGAPAKVTDFLASAPAWLQIESASPDLARTVSDELDGGEREAIALAEHVHADLILMDDLAGRAEARRRNSRVTGTLGVLREAAERSLIDVPGVIASLNETSFYFDEELILSIFGKWLRG